MKKTILLISSISLLFALQNTNAQQPAKKNQEEIQGQRTSYIIEQIALTPDESKAFTPIYRQYLDKLKSLRDQYKTHKDPDNPTDAELETLMNNTFIIEERIIQVKKEYNSIFKAIIPIKKVAKLYKAEREFNSDLLKTLQKK